MQLRPEPASHWYTLAVVQYRHGRYGDSLASLDKMKVRQGEFEPIDWLLVAMNQYQLEQKDAANAALSQAKESHERSRRKAERDALLWLEFELTRPGFEALRQEAEELIRGRDPRREPVGWVGGLK